MADIGILSNSRGRRSSSPILLAAFLDVIWSLESKFFNSISKWGSETTKFSGTCKHPWKIQKVSCKKTVVVQKKALKNKQLDGCTDRFGAARSLFKDPASETGLTYFANSRLSKRLGKSIRRKADLLEEIFHNKINVEATVFILYPS